MKNLINFFFSFDKLFKEKLIAPVFWLAIIFYGLKYLVQAVDGVQLDPLNFVIIPLAWLVKIFLTLLIVRIAAELAVAIFRINDNLSPDKGKSELADIDPVAEARKAAELAAARAREATKTVGVKAQAATKSAREGLDEVADTVQAKAKSASASVKSKTEDLTSNAKERTESIMSKGSAPEPAKTPTAAKTVEPKAVPKKRGRPAGSKNKPKATTASTTAKKTAPKAAPKKRGRPAGSKNKTTTAKSSSTSAPKKRGPKPGTKIPRDADGNLLKKDGTPRAKPGRKPKS